MSERTYILNGNYKMLDALIAERDRLKRTMVEIVELTDRYSPSALTYGVVNTKAKDALK